MWEVGVVCNHADVQVWLPHNSKQVEPVSSRVRVYKRCRGPLRPPPALADSQEASGHRAAALDKVVTGVLMQTSSWISFPSNNMVG